jgi:hypothetical protein
VNKNGEGKGEKKKQKRMWAYLQQAVAQGDVILANGEHRVVQYPLVVRYLFKA